eukprot:TRINITY_DN2810_c0_g1_i3.p1 TRINITY_DN2810_c0_g1~~TRINITY_DN2810_c0_g1_i3.p1  ORF type:complete len:454 (+),score=37.44 TRINITY_DN2810_c0_g1_i3:605-1966(+)
MIMEKIRSRSMKDVLSYIKELLSAMDQDHNGKISYKTFRDMLEISYSINVDDDVFREHFAKYIDEAKDTFDYNGFIEHLSRKSAKVNDNLKLTFSAWLNVFIDTLLAIQSETIVEKKNELDKLIRNDQIVDFNYFESFCVKHKLGSSKGDIVRLYSWVLSQNKFDSILSGMTRRHTYSLSDLRIHYDAKKLKENFAEALLGLDLKLIKHATSPMKKLPSQVYENNNNGLSASPNSRSRVRRSTIVINVTKPSGSPMAGVQNSQGGFGENLNSPGRRRTVAVAQAPSGFTPRNPRSDLLPMAEPPSPLVVNTSYSTLQRTVSLDPENSLLDSSNMSSEKVNSTRKSLFTLNNLVTEPYQFVCYCFFVVLSSLMLFFIVVISSRFSLYQTHMARLPSHMCGVYFKGSNAALPSVFFFLSCFPSSTQQYHILRRSCLLYTSPSPRDGLLSRMPSSA